MRVETPPRATVAPNPAPPERRRAPRRVIGPLAALGRARARWWAEDAGRPVWQGAFWTGLLVALLIGFALKVGAADWYTDFPLVLSDGRTIRLPNAFASIDHPFHIARERAIVDALREGRLPAWFSSHQAGFPAEFYPTGAGVIVALAYFLAFGQIPLTVVHKLVVIGVFLLPPLAYWAIARRERLPLSVPLLAALLHLFVRGNWLAGGSRELIDFGLWTDVLASYLPLFLILWGADWLRRGDRRGLALAAGAATLAVYTNPRSTLGIVAAALALGLVALAERLRVGGLGGGLRRLFTLRRGDPVWSPALNGDVSGDRPIGAGGERDARSAGWRATTRGRPYNAFVRFLRNPLIVLAARSATLALLVGLLSAALLLPLRDNQDLYAFTVYFRFEAIGQVWTNPETANGVGYIESVLPPVITLAGVGIVVGLLRRGFYGRVFAILLPLSYLIVTVVGWHLRDNPLFAQLEGPRLMPMLRPATIFLAALGAHEALRLGTRLFRIRGGTMLTGAATTVAAALILLAPQVPLDNGQRGLPLEQTTDQPAFTAIARAAYRFDELAGPADKPLIIGNNMISWHDSFWVPALTGRDVFHNDWLWFWRGVDYGYQELLQDERGALDAGFLYRHGITMVLIDYGRRDPNNPDDLINIANRRTYFTLLDPGEPGGYAIYRVDPPLGPPNGYLIPEAGTVLALDPHPERLRATVRSDRPNAARVIINHFPRWEARINGEPVRLERTYDGYIQVPLPAGEATVELRYTTSPANWRGRALVTLGLALLLGIVAGPALRRRLRRR